MKKVYSMFPVENSVIIFLRIRVQSATDNRLVIMFSLCVVTSSFTLRIVFHSTVLTSRPSTYIHRLNV
jgi:hypothetical protein